MLRPFLGSWFSLALILDTTAPVWQAPQPTHTSSYLELPALLALPFLTVLEQPALSDGSPRTTCPSCPGLSDGSLLVLCDFFYLKFLIGLLWVLFLQPLQCLHF